MAKNTKPMNNWNYLFYLGQGVEDTMWFYRLLGKLGTQKKKQNIGCFLHMDDSFLIVHHPSSSEYTKLAISDMPIRMLLESTSTRTSGTLPTEFSTNTTYLFLISHILFIYTNR